jgi:hypothetical protein
MLGLNTKNKRAKNAGRFPYMSLVHLHRKNPRLKASTTVAILDHKST